MDKYDGRYAFWEKYEISNLNQKRSLLLPVARKIMKDIVVPAKNFTVWESKLNVLIDNLIKGYDIAVEYKNTKITELEDFQWK